MRNALVQIGIILFCLWHMFAVAIFAIPRGATDALSTDLRTIALPFVSPYIFSTSQWQQWNMFSPDPLREVMTYACDAEQHGEWKTLMHIDPEQFTGLRKGMYFKILENLINPDANNLDIARHRLLTLCTCEAFDLAANTPVRLVRLQYALPDPITPQPASWWRQHVPEWTSSIVSTATCADTSKNLR